MSEKRFPSDDLRDMRDSIGVGLICTAFALGVIDELTPSRTDSNREYLLEIAQKNPRVFQIICEADSLRKYLADGNKIID